MVYVAVIFWCCIQREPRWWTLLPFVLPLGYWLGMALVQRLSHPRWYWPVRVTLLLLLVALAVGLMQLQNVLLVSPQRVRLFYFLQEAVMLWLMVAVFARSLLPGKTPLCSAVAVLSHPVMTPAVWRYTRGVTLAWALDCGAVAGVGAVVCGCIGADLGVFFAGGSACSNGGFFPGRSIAG